MNLAFWFLVLVLVGGAAAYWWFFMRSNGEGSDKQGGEQAGEENRVDLSEDSTTGGTATPGQPSSTEGEDQNSGENTTPSV